MAIFYKGTEIKFAINIKAEGFDMDDPAHDFDVTISTPKAAVTGYKGVGKTSDTDVVIYSEDPVTVDYTVADICDSAAELQGLTPSGTRRPGPFPEGDGEDDEEPAYDEFYAVVKGAENLYRSYDGVTWTPDGQSISQGMTVKSMADGHAYTADSEYNWTDKGVANGKKTWYVIVNTEKLNKGDMRVIATAHIPDANANDGVRNEVAVGLLGQLLIP